MLQANGDVLITRAQEDKTEGFRIPSQEQGRQEHDPVQLLFFSD